MVVENQTTKGDELLSYVVASGDMRCIDIAQRVLYLFHDSELGYIIRGELPECAPESYVNLSHILLEYVMSCDDRREREQTAAAADTFGQLLGQKIVEFSDQRETRTTEAVALERAVKVVLNSMETAYEISDQEKILKFTLEFCPLQREADKSGLNLWVPVARRSLIALIETAALGLGPSWFLRTPAERESDIPINEISFSRF